MTNEQRKIIKARVGVLELEKQLGNVSHACKVMGYSRDTFYRYKELYEQGGEEALLDVSKRKPIEKNRVAPEVEKAVCEIAIDEPAYGQVRASNELRKKGIFVSAGGVRSIWLRNKMIADDSTDDSRHSTFLPKPSVGVDGTC